MAAYLELHLKGGGCAIVETGSICATIAHGHDTWSPGTADSPTLVVIRGGATLEVIGDSPGLVIARCVKARADLRNMVGVDAHVDWLTPLDGGQADAADGQPFGD